jgi:hypothetical protein
MDSFLLSSSCHAALEVAERYADGSVTDADLDTANSAVGREATQVFNAAIDRAVAVGRTDTQEAGMQAIHGHGAILAASAVGPVDALNAAGNAITYLPEGRRQTGRIGQCHLIRDIFGPSVFRPVIFSPEWRTDTVVTLARQMYDPREFSAMPILADALQDAGCDNDDILNHCRSDGPHARGCWVVDLVLGKQ